MFSARKVSTTMLVGCALVWVVLVMFAGPADAFRFSWGDLRVSLNNELSVGGIVRVESRDPDLVAKLSNNPELCPEDCLDLGSDYDPGNPKTHIDEFIQAPGGYAAHLGDDGNLRFDKWDLASAIVSLNSDLVMRWHDFTFNMTTVGFYDFVNANGEEYHPDNFLDVPKVDGNPVLGVGKTETAFQPRHSDLTDAAEEMIGYDYDILAAFVSTHLSLFGHKFTLSVGEQRIHWGVALFNVLGSLDAINPVNQNRLYRPGADIAAVFEPVGLITLSTRFTRTLNIQLIYQYDWERSVPAAGSSLFGFIEPAAGGQYATLSLGQISEGADAHFTNDLNRVFTSADLGLQVDHLSGRPDPGGQYGMRLNWYLPELNGGTQLSFYYLNYDARLPSISIIAADKSCIRQPVQSVPGINVKAITSATGLSGLVNAINNVTDGLLDALQPGQIASALAPVDNLTLTDLSTRAVKALIACGGFNGSGTVANALQTLFEPLQPAGYTDEPLPAGTVTPVLDYPEDIHMFGISFTTNLGKWSLAGEYAYRPNQPFAVQPADMLFAGLQPALPDHDINLLVGVIPSNRHAVPDFVATRYRDNTVTANEYIEGYVRLPMHTFDFTGLRIFGTGNWLAADQVILAVEVGGTWIPQLPEPHEVPLTSLWLAGASHPSKGIAGPGDANPHSAATTLNPHQQTENFPTEFSGGINMLLRMRYYNFIFGKTYLPQIAFQWDVVGIAPFPIQNYVEGRKQLIFLNTLKLTQSLKIGLTYQAFFGGVFNNLHDRDNIRFSVSYSF